MGFSSQEYWSGLPCPPPGDLPDPEIELRSPTLQVDLSPNDQPSNIIKLGWVPYELCLLLPLESDWYETQLIYGTNLWLSF